MYFWPCIAVWGLDRLMRYGRILALNRYVGRATVAFDPTSKMLRLKVPTRAIARPHAGTYYYVYILHGFKLWESHPFTLSSWDAASIEGNARSETPTNLNFIIRPLEGFTARLQMLATRSTASEDGVKIPQERRILALVEGPYGKARRIDSHASALFVVGGSGVTVAISHLRSLHSCLARGRKLTIRKVHIVWAVREVDLALGIIKNDVVPLLRNAGLATKLDVQFDIYVTQEDMGASAVEMTSSNVPVWANGCESGSPTLQSLTKDGVPSVVLSKCSTDIRRTSGLMSAVRFHAGRPPLLKICMEHAHRNSSQDDRAALVCCGPPSMSDEVRKAVISGLEAGLDGVDYFPESFSW